MKKAFAFSLLALNLYSAEFALSFGVHDMIVPNAKPLSQTIYEVDGSGRDSHTLGVNVALHGKSDPDSFVLQEGYFRVLRDYDIDELDSDHIPIWFLGEYEAKIPFYSIQNYGRFLADLDISGKANTVSCVERLTRFFTGIKYESPKEKKLYFDASLLFGRYALEIDDDTPAMRGYTRESLKEINFAGSLKLNVAYDFTKDFSAYTTLQTWQSSSETLEKYVKVGFNYDTNEFLKGSKLYLEASYDWYNLDAYQRPGLMPILPWHEDMLINTYLKIPVNLESLFAKK